MKELIVHPDKSARAPATVFYVEPFRNEAFLDGEVSGIVNYWHLVRNHWVLIALMVAVGASVGIMISLFQVPVYQARVSLEIQNPTEKALNVPIAGFETDGAVASPEAYLPTQAQILHSETLRKRAIARLRRQSTGQMTRTADRVSYWHARLDLALNSPPPRLPIPSQGDVKVRVEENTRIIEILVDSTDGQAAADYANALANEYIDSNLQARKEGFARTHEFLTSQLDEFRSKLQNSEGQLQAYGRASNLMFTAGKSSLEQEKLKQAQEALSQSQAARIEKQSSYQMASTSNADSVPQVLDNTRLSEYQSQLATLRRQLAELSSQFTPEHPKVRQVQAQIDELESTFKRERNNVLVRVRNEYQAALTRERLLTSVYRKEAEVVSQEIQKITNYNILEREAETNRQLYDSLLQKAKEADIVSTMRGSNAQIIDPAEVPPRPYKPNIGWNTLMGVFSGVLAGLALILGRESIDRSFKGPGEVSFHLKLPELGVIPFENTISIDTHAGRHFTLTPLPPKTSGMGQIETATWRDKYSVITEAFRSALTSILFSCDNGASPRVILISSTSRGEGKTTVVSNLGISLAEINQRVLLIDADMRQPRLNTVFNVPNSWGLSDLLKERNSLRDCPLEALAQRTEIPNLYILTSGPRTINITNLLHSGRMLELLQRLRSEFDCILIDTPPMMGISDARILGRLVDAVILVFRAGKTNRDVAMAAKRQLTADGIPVIGTILNAWDRKTMNRYGYGSPYNTYESP